MQEPIENLSREAQNVHAYLDAEPDRNHSLEEIAGAVGLSVGVTAYALRELQDAGRAAEAMGPKPWSVVR